MTGVVWTDHHSAGFGVVPNTVDSNSIDEQKRNRHAGLNHSVDNTLMNRTGWIVRKHNNTSSGFRENKIRQLAESRRAPGQAVR
jgi:hypothetical protein